MRKSPNINRRIWNHEKKLGDGEGRKRIGEIASRKTRISQGLDDAGKKATGYLAGL
jgi:hypothetical protein